MQFQPVCPVHFIRPQQLHPRFCIFRPGGVPTPLIAIDELPSWLQVSNPSPDMYIGLQPVSPSYIPREGEYEVTCINCSSSVSSVNQSMSDRNEDIQSSHSSVSANKSCTGTPCNGSVGSAAAVVIPKFPIEFNIGTPPSMQRGRALTNIPPLAPQNIPLPASQPPSVGGSVLSSENLSSEPSKSDRPDTPATSSDSSKGSSIASTRSLTANVERLRQKIKLKGSSVDSSNATSIASTRSVTAAVERLKERIKLKGPFRRASFRHKVHRAVQADSDRQKNSKYHRVHSESHRIVKVPRRPRIKLKESKSTRSSLADGMKEEELKPEQSNSSTKRRARRERLTQRLLLKNDVDRKSRYWHMSKISK
ncbi:hypothetical protein N7507_009444 [Penicillium longicatenatum]|nr:hypothetical protein N7507_009444 [Penicillium longicatenatum]